MLCEADLLIDAVDGVRNNDLSGSLRDRADAILGFEMFAREVEVVSWVDAAAVDEATDERDRVVCEVGVW